MKMCQCKYPNLFSPIQLGNTLFRNRIFTSPTGLFYSDTHHRPINETICYNERKAKGGAASVCVGDAMVDGTHGLHGIYNMRLDDPEMMPVLNKLSSQISRHGAVATMQMVHTGSAANVSYYRGEEIYGPQAGIVTGSMGHPPAYAHAMNRDIMDRIIKQHIDSAALLKRCGFGMIQLQASHGFLLHQFISPTINHRIDAYGGSFENRMRFPMEIIRAVRETVGRGFPIEIRIAGSEGHEGGYGIDYGCRIAEALDGLVDLIQVSVGSHEVPEALTVLFPSMFLEDGVHVNCAAEVKKHVKHSKIAAVGALSDPDFLEEIIASGKADVVELARGLICDPDLPNKARTGHEDEIRKCMRCYTCYSGLLVHGQIVCALNPEISDESERKFQRPEPIKKKVLVVGGGVAGMEAALTCAYRGHDVILCEKADTLGGVLLCEEKVPFKKHLAEYLRQQAVLLSSSGVEVRLHTPVTKELACEIKPDVIIAAIGSRPLIPKIPGIDNPIVAMAEQAYACPDMLGRNVVILGGGLVGSELAIYLAGRGHSVTILEMMTKLNAGDNKIHGMAIGFELKRLSINTELGTKAIEITDKGVLGENEEGQKLFGADTVVCALGLCPSWDAAEELRFCAPEFHEIGDCIAPKNIHEATRTAHQIALDLGEKV
jgi:2,4-dienoyl-CoA reductase-like NADH-dependent reductase (Old Yellow Enzyme family)/thioredoxin reductase